MQRPEAADLAAGLARRSLLEVLPDGRFDMLTPIRRHGAFLTASTDDALRTREGLVRWADRVVPQDVNYRRGRRALARRHAGDEGGDHGRGGRAGDAGHRLRAGQPGLLLALHRHAGARGRGDPRGGPGQRRRPGHDRRAGGPEGRDRGVRGARHLRGTVAPRALRRARAPRPGPRPGALPQRLDPRGDAPRRRRARPGGGRGPARHRPRRRRARGGAGHPDDHRRAGLTGRLRRGPAERPAHPVRHQRLARALDRAVHPHPAGPDRARAGALRRGRVRRPRGVARRGPGRRGARRPARRDRAAPARAGHRGLRRRPREPAVGGPAAGARPGRPRPLPQRRHRARRRPRG